MVHLLASFAISCRCVFSVPYILLEIRPEDCGGKGGGTHDICLFFLEVAFLGREVSL